MNQNYHSSAEFIGLASTREFAAFKSQLLEYATSLQQRLKESKEIPLQDLADNLKAIPAELAHDFHLHCKLLQNIASQLRQRQLDPDKARALFRTVPVILENLLEPDALSDDILNRGYQWLKEQNAHYPEQVVFVHASAHADLMLRDHLAWALLERNNIPHLRWNLERLMEPASQEAAKVVAPELQLTPGQARALESLSEIYGFHRQRRTVAGISTQAKPLLIGPSGIGKTALIRHFADNKGLPLLDINSATWMVTGASSKNTTLRLIRNFITHHSEGVIYIDELDKFIANGDWMRCVQQECMALVDQRTSSFENWCTEDLARLQRFFIVGAGTWQNLCYESKSSIGFGLGDEIDITEKISNQSQIPDEILFRFPHVIELKGLSTGDFKQRIIQIRAELNLPIISKECLASLAHEAVESRRQNRWLEQYVVQALREKSYPQ